MSAGAAFGRILALAGLSEKYEPGDVASVSEALERARVVGVLDGWAEKNSARYQVLSLGASLARASLVKQGTPACHFDANTPGAARAAAARAIEKGEV